MENNLEELMPISFNEDNEGYISLRDFHEFLGMNLKSLLEYTQSNLLSNSKEKVAQSRAALGVAKASVTQEMSSDSNNNTATDLKTNFRDTSKLLGIRENLFVNWLILNKYIYRDSGGNLKPYAKVMNYFNLRTYSTTAGHCGIQTLINSEGREAFRKLLINEQIIK